MTLVLNEIHARGMGEPSFIVAAADRRISRHDGSYDSMRTKLFELPRFHGAVSYFGLASFGNRAPQTYMSDWLSNFIRHSATRSLEEFAHSLRKELNKIVPHRQLAQSPSGFHICGISPGGIPDFWFVRNIKRMKDFSYEELQDSYFEPTSDFLGRDVLANGWDPPTGRGPAGLVQIYRNGDIRGHAVMSERLDHALGTLGEFPDFRYPRSPSEFGDYARFKIEVIAYIYKKWAKKDIISRPIDVLVLTPPKISLV